MTSQVISRVYNMYSAVPAEELEGGNDSMKRKHLL